MYFYIQLMSSTHSLHLYAHREPYKTHSSRKSHNGVCHMCQLMSTYALTSYILSRLPVHMQSFSNIILWLWCTHTVGYNNSFRRWLVPVIYCNVKPLIKLPKAFHCVEQCCFPERFSAFCFCTEQSGCEGIRNAFMVRLLLLLLMRVSVPPKGKRLKSSTSSYLPQCYVWLWSKNICVNISHKNITQILHPTQTGEKSLREKPLWTW